MKNSIKGDWNAVKGMLRQIFSKAEENSNEIEESQEKKSEQYNKPINPNF